MRKLHVRKMQKYVLRIHPCSVPRHEGVSHREGGGMALPGEDARRLTGRCLGREAWPCPAAAGTSAPPWFSAAIAPFRSPTRQVICQREHVGRRPVVSGVYGRRTEARGGAGRGVNAAGDSDGQRAPFSDPCANNFLGILSTSP